MEGVRVMFPNDPPHVTIFRQLGSYPSHPFQRSVLYRRPIVRETMRTLSGLNHA